MPSWPFRRHLQPKPPKSAKTAPAKAGGTKVLSALKPTKLLVELTALIVLLMLGWLVWSVWLDQRKHNSDPAYVAERRELHQQMCLRHFDSGADTFLGYKLSELPANLERFYDQAIAAERHRILNLPTDFAGKLDLFFLCSSLRTLGLGGLEIDFSPVAAVRDAFDEKEGEKIELVDDLQATGAQIASSENVDPDLVDRSESLRAQIAAKDEELQRLEVAIEELATVATGSNVTFENLILDLDPMDSDEWILVTGADQQDEAAIDQVKTISAIVDTHLTGDLAQAHGETQLYLIRSWKRTVVPFQNERLARAALTALEPHLPYGGYVRATKEWCPDFTDAPDIGGIPTTRCEN